MSSACDPSPRDDGDVDLNRLVKIIHAAVFDAIQSAMARHDVSPQPKLRSRVAVANHLGVSLRTFDRLRAAGEFPAPTRIVGRAPRWSNEVVEQWLASSKGTAR